MSQLSEERHGQGLARPQLLGIEQRFISVISVLSLVIFASAILIFLYGLPYSGYRGWIAHEKERAFRTLDRLADIQKHSLAHVIHTHLHEVHLLATILQRDGTLQKLISDLKKLGKSAADDTIREFQIEESVRIHRQFMEPLFDLGFRKCRIVALDSHKILAANDQEEVGQLWPDKGLLHGLTRTGQVYSKPKPWLDGESPLLHMASLLHDDSGQALAAVILDFPVTDRLLAVQNTLENLWKSSETVILSLEGDKFHAVVVPDLGLGRAGRRFEDALFLQSAKGHEGVGEGRDDQGRRILVAYRHLRLYAEWSWGLAVKVDLDELLAPVDRAIRLAVIIGMASVVIFILAAAVMTRRVTRPLRQLTGIAQRVASGERHVRMTVEGSDEIAVLAGSMKALIDTIEGQLEQLEGRVEQRTRALSQELATRQHTEWLLRESEARLNAILDNASSIIFLKDQGGRYLLANRRFREMFGMAAVPIEGQSDEELFSQEVAAPLRQHDLQAMKNLGPTENEEFFPHADGRHTYLVVRFPLVDEKGGGLMVGGIGADISERKRMERHLRQSQKLEAIGTLAGGISHDFNNILAIIVGNAELGAMVVAEGSEEKGCFNTILDASRRGRDLVNQLLTFSRQGENIKEMFDPLPVVKETMRFMRSTFPVTIPFHWHVLVQEGSLFGDPTRLQQVFINLCTNAAQSVEEVGHGEVVVSWDKTVLEQKRADDLQVRPGPYFTLTVVDQGKGITEEVRDRLFDPFFTTKVVGRGTGLGLSVVHGIISDWKGVMEIQGRVNEGATFTVYLPWHPGGQVFAGEQERLPVGKGRVLFVDDEIQVVAVVQRQLVLLGYEAVCFFDPGEALAAFMARPDSFDLVVSDHLMAGMNGLEFIGRVKEIRGDMPSVICTGLRSDIPTEKRRAMGIAGILHKPVGIFELGAVLRQLIPEERGRQW